VETQHYSTRRADILSHITRTAGTSWSDSSRVRYQQDYTQWLYPATLNAFDYKVSE